MASEWQDMVRLAEVHSRHPANYLQTCQLCCKYVNLYAEGRGAINFWKPYLEYLHTVIKETSLHCDPDEPSWVLQVKVLDTEKIQKLFNALYTIFPEETTISIYDDIIQVSVFEPDILTNFLDWSDEEEEEEDIRKQPTCFSLSTKLPSLRDGRRH